MWAPWPSRSCPSCLHTELFPSEPSLSNYHPTTTVRQQGPALLSPKFHLVASTRQKTSFYFTPESPLLFSFFYTNTTCNDGSKKSAMIGIATETFTTCMQPYPIQPTSHIKRDPLLDKDSVHRTVAHGESHKIFTSPLKKHFPAFHYPASRIFLHFTFFGCQKEQSISEHWI